MSRIYWEQRSRVMKYSRENVPNWPLHTDRASFRRGRKKGGTRWGLQKREGRTEGRGVPSWAFALINHVKLQQKGGRTKKGCDP